LLSPVSSYLIGCDNEKQIDMVVQKEGLEPFTCLVCNGYYSIPMKDADWTVEFENDKLDTIKLKYRHWPVCTTKGTLSIHFFPLFPLFHALGNAEIGSYAPGEYNEMTIWYTKSKS
jgi:hypothetical protein